MANQGPTLSEGIGKALGVAQDIVLVTPHDTNDNIPNGTRALLIGVAGTINVTTLKGNDIDGIIVPAGYNPISVLRVRTGGTATDIYALL